MRTVIVAFPDNPAIDEPYRGKIVEAAYEIKIGESGLVETSVQIGGRAVGRYTKNWVLDYVSQGEALENFAENAPSGDKKRPAWPAEDWR